MLDRLIVILRGGSGGDGGGRPRSGRITGGPGGGTL